MYVGDVAIGVAAVAVEYQLNVELAGALGDITAGWPLQAKVAATVGAAGAGITVTTVLPEAIQPLSTLVTVRWYVVVTLGVACGSGRLDVNPDGVEVQL